MLWLFCSLHLSFCCSCQWKPDAMLKDTLWRGSGGKGLGTRITNIQEQEKDTDVSALQQSKSTIPPPSCSIQALHGSGEAYRIGKGICITQCTESMPVSFRNTFIGRYKIWFQLSGHPSHLLYWHKINPLRDILLVLPLVQGEKRHFVFLWT